MGHRLSRITTRTGDSGLSGLADGSRLPKTDLRFVAMGDLDELNSQLGILRSIGVPAAIDPLLEDIQQRLFDLGGELALPGYVLVKDVHLLALEQHAEALNASLPPLKEFVLPGGPLPAAHAHMARAIARRAERSLWAVHAQSPVNDLGLRYLNRLSDLLFVLARTLARAGGEAEALWQRERRPADSDLNVNLAQRDTDLPSPASGGTAGNADGG